MCAHKRETGALRKTNLVSPTLQRIPTNTTASFKMPNPLFLAKLGEKLNVLVHCTAI